MSQDGGSRKQPDGWLQLGRRVFRFKHRPVPWEALVHTWVASLTTQTSSPTLVLPSVDHSAPFEMEVTNSRGARRRLKPPQELKCLVVYFLATFHGVRGSEF